jgi:DNA-binding Xre family transcriptional regulator
MKVVKTNFLRLLAEKQQREGRRISLKQAAKEAGVKDYTVYGFANSSLREYPATAIAKLCTYFNCEVGDLLTLEEVPNEI